MVKLAIYHATLPQYLRASADEADQKNLQIVLSGERKEQLLAAAVTGSGRAGLADGWVVCHGLRS